MIKEALTLKDTTIKPIIVPEPNLPYLMYEPHKILWEIFFKSQHSFSKEVIKTMGYNFYSKEAHPLLYAICDLGFHKYM